MADEKDRRGAAPMAISIVWLGLALLGLLAAPIGLAQEPTATPPLDEILEARVGYIQEEREIEAAGQRQFYQRLELIVVSGPRQGEVLIVEHGAMPEANPRRYRVGERLFVRAVADPDAPQRYLVDIPSRWPQLLLIALAFGLSVALVARWRSLGSLAGLAISFAIVLFYVLPRLAAGASPLGVILLGSAIIVPLSFFPAHGVSLKTIVAVISTALALLLTALLAELFVRLTGLSGYASEEAAFLRYQAPAVVNIRALLIAGIVVGALGVLDDVTISQASIVQQLHQLHPQIGLWESFRRAMQVGQDHIASMVNTLALVYAGAALPLLLLLRTSPLPLGYLLSQEIIAEEIVRLVVASIGLVAAVPLTTLLASAAMAYRARLAPPPGS